MASPLALSLHAQVQMAERRIERQWIALAVAEPEFVRVDPRHPDVKLAFRRIGPANDRWLRVVYTERNHGLLVITAFFDRKAEKRR